MSAYEVIPCQECGEQTIATRPTCSLCEADKGLIEQLATPKMQDTFDPNRGAKQLIGATIARIDARAINVITLIGTDGTEYAFSAEAGPLGIPVVYVTKDPK